MTRIAVAAVSARMMTEAAARDGLDVVALDLFGDVDTCAVASRWHPIGKAGSLHIDAARTLAALRLLARRGDALGWVAGSGFEGRHDLLADGARALRLIGTAPEAVRAVRDPVRFFAFLDAHGIAHPEVSMSPPPDAAGWLRKDANGCGGWHIRPAAPLTARRSGEVAAAALADSHYFQREMPGLSMSVTFLANARDAVVLGFNQQIVRRVGALPYVFSGAAGPVPVAPAIREAALRIVRKLAAGFALQGLASLDFLLDADRISVLEVNPRPPASIGLYAEPGVMTAHVQACLHGELALPSAGPATRINGFEIVFARRRLVLDATAAARLAVWPGAHDLPCAGAKFEPGDPVCSLFAGAGCVDDVLALLAEARVDLLKNLET